MDNWLQKCEPPIANTCCHFYLWNSKAKRWFCFFMGQVWLGKGEKMIDVTKMNGMNITINSDLIETVEETPDTVITLTTGRKIIVKESRQTIKYLVKSFKRECTFMD